MLSNVSHHHHPAIEDSRVLEHQKITAQVNGGLFLHSGVQCIGKQQ
jgi:hypothetical protein